MERPAGFRLEHNGFEWAGSFQTAVTAVFTGMLHDGPIHVDLTLVDDNDHIRVEGHTLTGITDQYLYVDGEAGEGGQIDRWDHLLGVSLP